MPTGRGLPDSAGPLSVTVPSPAIERANEEPRIRSGRGTYHTLSDSLRAEIGKWACDSGVANTARKF